MSTTIEPPSTHNWGKLRIHGEPVAVDKLLATLETLPNGWQRNRELEQRLQDAKLARANVFYYTPHDWKQNLNKSLRLWRSDDPWQGGESALHASREPFVENVVLGLVDDVLVPTALQLGLQIDIIPQKHPFEEYSARHIVRELREFLEHVPANTSVLTPELRRRWKQCVIAWYDERDRISIDLFADWLQQQGYTSTLAEELVDNFYDISEILRDYIETRPRV